MEPVTIRQPSRPSGLSPAIGGAILVAWFLVLCLVPDPRPLGVPDAVVSIAGKVTGVSEVSARAASAFALRAVGIALLGFLVALCWSRRPLRQSAIISLLSAPPLAILAMWFNYGYFPISFQIQFAIVFAVVGVSVGLSLRKNLTARIALVVIVGGLFLWGVPHGISDSLDRSARITGVHVLANVEEIPAGDDGFTECLELAFRFAQENSEATDPVNANEAAILALGVILGDERVATVARRSLDKTHRDAIRPLRRKVKLRGRSDLPQHFWVSAALTVLSDGNRSTAVGVMKELMDSNPGGSGFSFVDLLADRAGVLFAEAATRDAESALTVQSVICEGLIASDFCPPIEDLPEGIPRDDFQAVYGGLGGQETNRIVQEMKQRLQECRGLWVESKESIDILP